MTDRWFLTQHSTVWSRNALKISVKTNIPVKLHLNWTPNRPIMRLCSRTERGFTGPHYPDYPIVDPVPLSSIDPGEATNHLFSLENWDMGQIRYWYFHGTIGIEPTNSVSPIFHIQFFWPWRPR